MSHNGISERQCSVCKKNIAYSCESEQWAYQIIWREKRYFCCSYSCLQKVKQMKKRRRIKEYEK